MLSRGQGEYIAAVIAVISMVLLSMLYVSILEGIHRETLLSIKRIDSLREDLEVVYDRGRHTLSIEGGTQSSRALYILYIANGSGIYIDRIDSGDRYINLTLLPTYTRLVKENLTISNICIVTYAQNMFCTNSNRQPHTDGNNLAITATVSKCTVMLSRYLSSSDMFQLFNRYYTYNCSMGQYPLSSIDFRVSLSFSGDAITYSVTGSDDSVWGSGSIPYSSLPTASYILLGSRSFSYSLGVANLTVEVYVYYSFPEAGTVQDVGGVPHRYIYTVPRIVVVQRLEYRDYLLLASGRSSCTSPPCYLLYAVKDFVDYPWNSYSGDFGWFSRATLSTRDYTTGSGYSSSSTIRAIYRVSASGAMDATFNNDYSYTRVENLPTSPLTLSTVESIIDLSSNYGYWLPKDFITPVGSTGPQVYNTYVRRAMSIYDTSYARFYIYSYYYNGNLFHVYIDYVDPAVHSFSIAFRYGGDRTLYAFLLADG